MSYIGKTPTAVPLSSSDLADGIVSTDKLAANAVTTAKITDGTIAEADIANDAVTADKIANAINSAIAANTAKTGISSAQTSAITANTSKTTNATHSGEVTGATALTIAGNVVDEANLKVSNSPVNGYALIARSGNTGGMTWEAAGGGVSNAFLAEGMTGNASGVLPFSNEVFDDGGNYSTSNGKYIAPSAGKYFFTFHARSVSQTTEMAIKVNGSYVGGQNGEWGYLSGGEYTDSVTLIYNLSTNDQVTCVAVNNQVRNAYCWFAGAKLY